MIYQNNRDNFRMFNICLDDPNEPFTGEIQISFENEVMLTIPLKKSGLFSCCSAQRVKKVTNIEHTSLQNISYEVIKPKGNQIKSRHMIRMFTKVIWKELVQTSP